MLVTIQSVADKELNYVFKSEKSSFVFGSNVWEHSFKFDTDF